MKKISRFFSWLIVKILKKYDTNKDGYTDIEIRINNETKKLDSITYK